MVELQKQDQVLLDFTSGRGITSQGLLLLVAHGYIALTEEGFKRVKELANPETGQSNGTSTNNG